MLSTLTVDQDGCFRFLEWFAKLYVIVKTISDTLDKLNMKGWCQYEFLCAQFGWQTG